MNLNIPIKAELTLRQGSILAKALGGSFVIDSETGDINFKQGPKPMGESLENVKFKTKTEDKS